MDLIREIQGDLATAPDPIKPAFDPFIVSDWHSKWLCRQRGVDSSHTNGLSVVPPSGENSTSERRHLDEMHKVLRIPTQSPIGEPVSTAGHKGWRYFLQAKLVISSMQDFRNHSDCVRRKNQSVSVYQSISESCLTGNVRPHKNLQYLAITAAVQSSVPPCIQSNLA